MVYQFDTEDAEKHGLPEAVMLYNLRFWIRKNKANETHRYEVEIDGKTVAKTWTYNSIRAFGKLFPFWKKGQIGRILKKLTEQNIILKGNFNKTRYDRTLWYAFRDESFLADLEQKQVIDLPNSGNENTENGKPIPNLNPDKKTHNIGAETSAEKNLSKNTKEKKPRNDLERIERCFIEIYKKEYGVEPEINLGKVRKLETNLLKRHPAGELCAIIGLGIKDDWILKNNTFDLGTIFSASVFNRLLRQGRQTWRQEEREAKKEAERKAEREERAKRPPPTEAEKENVRKMAKEFRLKTAKAGVRSGQPLL